MTHITFNEIGLEDLEKNRGLCDFGIRLADGLVLQMEEMRPKKKENREIIIVRNGREQRNGKATELF
jgi:hypothetical protein